MQKQKYNGMTENQVIASRQKYGRNTITKKKTVGFFHLFLKNLSDPVIRVLLISLAVNVLFTLHNIDWFEIGGITLAIVLAGTISAASEHSSLESLKRLGERTSPRCTVRRDGETKSIPSEELAVGDILLLSAGERVAADGLLIRGEVFLDQSALTGESKEIRKAPASDLPVPPYALPTPESEHSCLGASLVASGEGEMLVTQVGDSTYLGRIAGELQDKKRDSPLKIRLKKLAGQISVLGYSAAVLIALLSLFSAICIESDFIPEVMLAKLTDTAFLAGEILHCITLGLTVTIMAVPEGLPMMVAVVLARGVGKMHRDNVLVKKQVGIEAAGSMDILFTDKTGTLTRSKMTVSGIILPDGTTLGGISDFKDAHPQLFQSFCKNCFYNSSAQVVGRSVFGNSATERALLKALGAKYAPPNATPNSKIPFDSKLKYSQATCLGITYKKGAPEVILASVNDPKLDRTRVEGAIREAQSRGARVIAFSENGAQFTCAAVLADPLRADAASSVAALREAGVSTVMITGDSEITARSIAERTGIASSARHLILTHTELEKMTDTEVRDILPHLAGVARALPQDKSRLVRIAQSAGCVVGMTGDGINDAPALRIADVGFAMGSGTDVAAMASDVVILDDSLSSIVRAVLYGRNIFVSIRKFLVFQLTMNFFCALVCTVAPFFGYDTPITVSQMLWVNMIMDTLGGVAFAGEAPHKRLLRRKPTRRDEPILNRYMKNQILVSGAFCTLVSMIFLISDSVRTHFRESEGDAVLLSAFFGLFIFLGVAQCINSRTDRLNLFSGIGKNTTFVGIIALICAIQLSFIYFGGDLLRATPLTPHELSFTVGCAALAIPADFLRKALRRLAGKTDGF